MYANAIAGRINRMYELIYTIGISHQDIICVNENYGKKGESNIE